jgi:hypothetical protein
MDGRPSPHGGFVARTFSDFAIVWSQGSKPLSRDDRIVG